MPTNKKESTDWKRIGGSVLSGLWILIKFIGKTLIWIAKKYWAWFESVGSDTNNPTQGVAEPEVRVDTVLIKGKPYYRDKTGRYRPMEV